jgi:hypothetical protein
MPKWEKQRQDFFKRAGLLVKAEEVPDYLTERLNQAYDDFLELLPRNSYATVNEKGGSYRLTPQTSWMKLASRNWKS